MIIDVAEEIRRALRRNTSVTDLVGIDDNAEYKVYEDQAPTDVQAPFVVIQSPPIGDTMHAYGGKDAAQSLRIQVGSWARTRKQVWQIASAVDDALDSIDASIEPFAVIGVFRVTPPVPLPDTESNFYRVEVGYDVLIGK